jgi:hypothetical protein
MELQTLSTKNSLEIFLTDKGLDPVLNKIREEIDSFSADVNTKKGREEIASMAHKIARSKTHIDNVGKELVAELKKQPSLIDAERKRIRDILDNWKDEVRRPLTEFEETEKRKIEKFKNGIDALNEIAKTNPLLPSTSIADEVKYTKETFVIDDSWEDFQVIAQMAFDKAISHLESIYEQAIRREEEQKELERLRAEAAERAKKDELERVAKEAAEKAKIEAEEKANREKKEIELKATRERELLEKQKKEAEARELKLKEEAVLREKQRIAAEQKAELDKQEAIKRERLRIEAEQKLAQEAAAKKAENINHKKKINNEILRKLLALGISEEISKEIITKAAKGELGQMKICY